MSEIDIIDNTRLPITVHGIVQDLKALGVREGDIVLVHSSMSSLGWVCGGPQAVVQALLLAIGETGTLVMPAQSGDWSDPAEWGNPPVPSAWYEIIYSEMPAFDPLMSPTRGMGRIAELFRTFPGTLRSQHPQVSFCANGKHAEAIVADHPLSPQFGPASPLGKLYELQRVKVLLLGVGYDCCTSFHLAESLLEGMPSKQMGAAIMEAGERTWKWFQDFAYDSGDFDRIGAQTDARLIVERGRVGNADSRLFAMNEAVDLAGFWLKANRTLLG